MDNIPIGGDVTGEDAGEKKAGDVEGGKCKGVRVRVNKGEVKTESDVKNFFNCKICGTFTKNSYDYKKHLSKNHSELAISIATTFNNKKKHQEATQIKQLCKLWEKLFLSGDMEASYKKLPY